MTAQRRIWCRSFIMLLVMVFFPSMAWAQTPSVGSGAAATPRATAGSGNASGAPMVIRLWREGDAGIRLHLRGRVLSTAGRPVEGAQIQLWQADGGGSYQPSRYRAAFSSARRGEFVLDTVVPGQYYGTKHIHLIVQHDAHQTLNTRILFKGDPYLDPVDEDLAILLEEVNKDGKTVMVGNVELVLKPAGSN